MVRRKPFQGVFNIVRFNWHFYLLAILGIVLISITNTFLPIGIQIVVSSSIFIVAFTTILSLLVSYYIYDVSDLYKLEFAGEVGNEKLLNINAGFDEISEIIMGKMTNSDLTICDFYDEEKHTEISIKRARKAYPPKSRIISVESHYLPFFDNNFDKIFAMLSAHEIRDEQERILFFRELNRIIKPNGEIFVIEHLRDKFNFLAYTIGFLHFYSRKNWVRTFSKANLILKNEIKITPFITVFILEKDGITN